MQESLQTGEARIDRDELTGLRNYFTLLRDFDYDEYTGEDVYVVLCDIDDFRDLNNLFGSHHCDDLLTRIATILRQSFGDRRTYHYGSDEFLLVNAFYDEYSFLDKLEQLNKRLDQLEIAGEPANVTMSYGYAYGRIPTSGMLHEAVRLADHKMFEAKRLGKARAVSVSLDEALRHGAHDGEHTYRSYQVDELTGLSNLIYFRNQLEHMLKVQSVQDDLAESDRIALVYFNIQNFKGYNQQFGFDVGDELLLLVSDAIRDAFPDCLASRFSADQFMVAATAGTAKAGFDKVRSAFRARRKDTSIWLRAGAYIPAKEDDNVGVNMDRAKIACDSIKGRRDLFFRFYDDELRAHILAHRYVLENLDHALENGWIKAFYQPIVRVATGEACDVEALSRWVDPERGIIPPSEFIPVLEDARLIHKLDLQIVECVCRDYCELARRGMRFIPPSVNLSRLDFELTDIVDDVTKLVDKYGIPHEFMSIEITESALSDNQHFLYAEIERFRKRGFQVWMDDFGSGYSSLNLLKEFEFDLVKIDMAFLREFETNELTRVILSHVIGMAKELGPKTLVEGVETKEQYEYLKSLGCGRAQGYYFSKPIDFASTTAAIEAGEYPPIEDPTLHDFYEVIGKVNLIRPNPTLPVNGHYVPGDVPAVIAERVGGVYRFLNVSDTYAQFLTSMGMSTVQESEDMMNGDRIDYVRLKASIDRSIISGAWEYTNYDDLGQHCTLLARCIAQCPERDAVAVIIITVGDYRLMDKSKS